MRKESPIPNGDARRGDARCATRAALGPGGALGLVAVASVLLGSGCGLAEIAHDEVGAALREAHDRQEREARAYGRLPQAAKARAATSAGGRETPAPPPAGEPRDLQSYLTLALRANREIRAAEARLEALVERVEPATALPDPMLQMTGLPTPVRTAEGDNYFNLTLSQRFLLPEKLSRKGRVALEAARSARWSVEQVRQRVLRDTKRAYFQLYVLDRSIAIIRESRRLLEGLVGVVRAQVAAGRRPQDDVLRAEVELSNLETEIVRLGAGRRTARVRLNSLLDRPSETPVPPPADFGLRHLDRSLEQLVARAHGQNPSLKALAHTIQQSRESLGLAELQYWPDLTLGVTWMEMQPRRAPTPAASLSEDAGDNVGLMLGLNIPIWFGKIRAGIREAKRTVRAAEERYAHGRDQVDFEVGAAFSEVQAERELTLLFRDTIIPQARQTYQVSQASYVSGRSSFIYVIDNWRRWLRFEIQAVRANGALEQAISDLEKAVGTSFEALEGER